MYYDKKTIESPIHLESKSFPEKMSLEVIKK